LYAWSGPNSFTATTASITAITAGTYTVIAIGDNGCTATATTSVTNDTTVPNPVANNAERCGPGEITLTATGCTGGTLNWYDAGTGGSSLATTSSLTVNITATTKYYVDCTVGTCTSPRVEASAIINDLPTSVTASSNTPVREGSPISLTSTSVGGTSYSWTGPSSFTSTLQNPSIASALEINEGVYTVTISTSKGCTTTATTQVVVYNLVNLPECTTATVSVTVSSNSPVNIGNVINLNALSITVIDYLWTGPNAFSSTLQSPNIANATLAMSGIYTLKATEDGICAVTSTVNVCVKPDAGADKTLVCVGVTPPTSTSVGTAPVGYTWSVINQPNGATASVNPLTGEVTGMSQTGIYTIRLQNGLGCSDDVLITIPPCDCPPKVCVPVGIIKTKSTR
jgi:hypothetical protein